VLATAFPLAGRARRRLRIGAPPQPVSRRGCARGGGAGRGAGAAGSCSPSGLPRPAPRPGFGGSAREQPGEPAGCVKPDLLLVLRKMKKTPPSTRRPHILRSKATGSGRGRLPRALAVRHQAASGPHNALDTKRSVSRPSRRHVGHLPRSRHKRSREREPVSASKALPQPLSWRGQLAWSAKCPVCLGSDKFPRKTPPWSHVPPRNQIFSITQ